MRLIERKIFEVEIEVFAFGLSMIMLFVGFSSYLILHHNQISKVSAAQPCIEDPIACAEDATVPSWDYEDVGTQVLVYATDFESGISDISMQYRFDDGSWVNVDPGDLSPNLSFWINSFTHDEVGITIDALTIVQTLDSSGMATANKIKYRFVLTNGNALTVETAEAVFKIPHFDLALTQPGRYRKFLEFQTSKNLTYGTCNKYIDDVEFFLGNFDGQDVYKTFDYGYDPENNATWTCDVSGRIDVEELKVTYSLTPFELTGQIFKDIKYRFKLSDGSYYPLDTDTPQYLTFGGYTNDLPYEITIDENYPTEANPEIRFTLVDNSVSFGSNDTFLDAEFYVGENNTVQLPVTDEGAYYKVDLTNHLNYFQGNTNVKAWVKTHYIPDDVDYYYPYRYADRSDPAVAAQNDQFIDIAVPSFLPQPPGPLTLTFLPDTTPSDVTLTINSAGQPAEISFLKIVRVDGKCTADNIPTDHTVGYTVWEYDTEGIIDFHEISDANITAGLKYCYALFYSRTDVGWIDTIQFGVSPNYKTGYTPGGGAPIATIDTYPEDPTTNKRPIITGIAEDPEGHEIKSIEYKIEVDSVGVIENWTSINPVDGIFDEPSEEFSFQPVADLPDGNAVFQVRVADEFDNIRQDGNHGRELITINAEDTTPPIVIIYDLPDQVFTQTPKIQFDVTDSNDDLRTNIASAEYSFDNSNWTAVFPINGAFDSPDEKFEIDVENNIPLGANTIYARATDSSGNLSEIKSLDITILTQDENLQAQRITLSESFDNTNNSARQITTAIWGNGIARLKAQNTLNRTTINNSYLADRYTLYSGDGEIEAGINGGFWVNVNPEGNAQEFMFANAAGQSELYNLPIGGINNQQVNGIKAVNVSGSEYVAVLYETGLVIINTNNTPLDSADDTYANYVGAVAFGGSSQFRNIEMIDRGGGQFGVLITSLQLVPQAWYVEPANTFDDINDGDQIVLLNIPQLSTGTVTKFKRQPGTNSIWICDVGGINLGRWNFGPNPADTGDDSVNTFPVQNVSDIVWNDNGETILGTYGSTGLVRLNNDNSLTTIATHAALGNFDIGEIHYLSDELYPLGEQFLVGTLGSGYIYHIYTNDTYEDPYDDQIIKYDLFEGLYPLDFPTIYVTGYNQFYLSSTRHGFFRFDMVRDYENSNIAISRMSADQHLYANFIRLESASVVAYENQEEFEKQNSNIFAKIYHKIVPPAKAQIPPNVQIQVTNNGVDWFDIGLGQTVQFPTADYRVRFRAVLTKAGAGDTPIVDDLFLTYAAYANASAAGVNGFSADFSSTSVCSNQNFSVDLQAVDILGNPVSQSGTVYLGIRKVGGAGNAPGLSVSSANMTGGYVPLNNVKINTTNYGTYQLVMGYNSQEYLSNTAIAVTNCAGGGIGNPTVTFTADKYFINVGEGVKLKWLTTNATKVEIVGIGEVPLSGELAVNPNRTTVYIIKVTGVDGKVTESKLTVVVAGTIPDMLTEVDKEEIDVGDKFTISWNAEGAEYVRITNIDGNLSPSGSIDISPDKAGIYEFEVTAYYPDGSTQTKRYSIVVNGRVQVSDILNLGGDTISAISLALLATSGTLGGATAYANGVFKIGILSILLPKRRKYWGIVYDENASSPIAFAAVRISPIDNPNIIVAQTISDLDGKYGMLVDHAGTYMMTVAATGFKQIERKITLTDRSDNLEIVEDVPLNKIEEEKGFWFNLINYKRVELYETLRKLFFVSTIIGLTYSIYAALVTPNWINYAILVFYAILFAVIGYTYYKKVMRGRVKDIETLRGIPAAAVRVYDTDRQLGMALTTLNGDVKIKIAPGKYKMSASKPGYELVTPDPKAPLVDVEVDEKGYFKNDIMVRKIVQSNVPSTLNSNMPTTKFGSA